MRHPLVATFGGSRAAVLEVLLDVEAGMGVREVARLSGLAPTTVSSAMRALAEIGVLRISTWSGGQTYSVNRHHALVEPLQQVLEVARGVDARVVAAVREAVPVMRALWLYGSRARGDESPASDADLVVIVRRAQEARAYEDVVTELSGALEALLGYPVWISVRKTPGAREWQQPFWSHIAEHAVALHGPEPRDFRGGAASAKSPVPRRSAP